MNSGNSKTCNPHRLLLNLSSKINLKTKDKYATLANVSIYYTWKNIKRSYKNNKFKISARHGMKSFNYLMENILYQIFSNILSISLNNMRQLLTLLQ